MRLDEIDIDLMESVSDWQLRNDIEEYGIDVVSQLSESQQHETNEVIAFFNEQYSHQLSNEDVGKQFTPINIHVIGLGNFISIAHLAVGSSELLQVKNEVYYFKTTNGVQRFPPSNNKGNMESIRIIFKDNNAFSKLMTLFALRFAPNWRITYREIKNEI